MRFRDRAEAGRLLAESLRQYAGREDVVVLGLPRGGVPVASALAARLAAQLDVFLVRKLGVPGREELAMGAVSSGGVRVLNDAVRVRAGVSFHDFAQAAARQERELVRLERLYRRDRPGVELRGRTAIVVDDGVATGATMLAAVHAVRERSPARIVVAVPLATRSACDELRPEVDELVCVSMPEYLLAVGFWYDDFAQTTDAEVGALLSGSAPVSRGP
jgi:predicted phosphoribosyltransferase